MIKLTHVSKVYPKRGFALRDVSFHLRKGEFAFLTGHSGSGKSTTMRLIHMADRPTEGEVRVSGYSSARVTERDLWKVRRRVGFVFQDFRLLPGRTALENVAFALEVTGTPPKAVQSKAQRLLSQVGLSAKVGAFVNELSGGEQQRVAIARALVNDPFVLLADEPTGNLDERATRGIMELFWDIQAKGMAVLMATHDLELIRSYPSTRVLELDQGELVYDSQEVDEAESRHDVRVDLESETRAHVEAGAPTELEPESDIDHEAGAPIELEPEREIERGADAQVELDPDARAERAPGPRADPEVRPEPKAGPGVG